MYPHTKKPYSPTGRAFPRRFLEPLLLAGLVILLIFFFRIERPEPTSSVAIFPQPTEYLSGYRPINESRIAIVTFTTEQKSYTHLSLKNKDYYAKKHGYNFYVDYDSGNYRGMMWHKFDMVHRVINAGQHDWVWWMDFDTLITNTNTKLVDIISEALANATDPDEIDYLFTPDWYVFRHLPIDFIHSSLHLPIISY